MIQIKLKGFKIYKDRHGRQRFYHRFTGFAIDLDKMPLGSTEFFAECTRIAALVKKSVAAKPSMLGKLILEYKKHLSFTDLAKRTKKDYERIFDYLKPINGTYLSRFTPPLVARIRDKVTEKMGQLHKDCSFVNFCVGARAWLYGKQLSLQG